MKKIAVIGLFNSGSTMIAGVLHRLGVNMGAPFWGAFYEPRDLRNALVHWWNEPRIRETVPQNFRVESLQAWLRSHTVNADVPTGAKHPLLCMCCDDLVQAWGEKTSVVKPTGSLT